MDFFVWQGATRRHSSDYGFDAQRSQAEKDAVLCIDNCEALHLALSADGACQDALARHLSERTAQGGTPCSLSSGSYCIARQRLPLVLILRLATATGERLEAPSHKSWKWRVLRNASTSALKPT